MSLSICSHEHDVSGLDAGTGGKMRKKGNVETNKWREDSRQKLDRVTVRTQEMQWGGITKRKEKFYPL